MSNTFDRVARAAGSIIGAGLFLAAVVLLAALLFWALGIAKLAIRFMFGA